MQQSISEVWLTGTWRACWHWTSSWLTSCSTASQRPETVALGKFIVTGPAVALGVGHCGSVCLRLLRAQHDEPMALSISAYRFANAVLCRIVSSQIVCVEYRSAVKASKCNAPQKTRFMTKSQHVKHTPVSA
jgi:hypothetical protein